MKQRTSDFQFLSINLAIRCFLFCFFMWSTRFQILICEPQSIWPKLSWLWLIAGIGDPCCQFLFSSHCIWSYLPAWIILDFKCLCKVKLLFSSSTTNGIFRPLRLCRKQGRWKEMKFLHISKSQYYFSNFNSNCSNLVDLINSRNKLKKPSATKNCSDLFE
mgnify:CR=1 FL=1